MSNEDFDLDRLAVYFHVTPQQIAKMAERGRLPGRKIGGQWRFSPAEIHHWLEDRIGASDEEELIGVEGVLDRAEPRRADSDQPAQAPSVSEYLPIEAIKIPLASRTRNSVIQDMVTIAAETGLLWDPAKMVEAVRARENLHPTALENGVALLHPQRPLASILAEPLLCLGRTHQGIPFGGSRGSLTDIFFLVCSVDDRGHLRLLARLSRLLSDADFLGTLRNVDDAQSARDLIQHAEAGLSGT